MRRVARARPRPEAGYIGILGLLFGVAIMGMLYWAWIDGAQSSRTRADDAATTGTTAGNTAGTKADVQFVHDAEGIKAAAEARDREYQKLIAD